MRDCGAVHLSARRPALPAQRRLRGSEQHLVGDCSCGCALQTSQTAHEVSFVTFFNSATARRARCTAARLNRALRCLTSSTMMTSRRPEVQREQLIRMAFIWSGVMIRDAFVALQRGGQCSAHLRSSAHTVTPEKRVWNVPEHARIWICLASVLPASLAANAPLAQ